MFRMHTLIEIQLTLAVLPRVASLDEHNRPLLHRALS